MHVMITIIKDYQTSIYKNGRIKDWTWSTLLFPNNPGGFLVLKFVIALNTSIKALCMPDNEDIIIQVGSRENILRYMEKMSEVQTEG